MVRVPLSLVIGDRAVGMISGAAPGLTVFVKSVCDLDDLSSALRGYVPDTMDYRTVRCVHRSFFLPADFLVDTLDEGGSHARASTVPILHARKIRRLSCTLGYPRYYFLSSESGDRAPKMCAAPTLGGMVGDQRAKSIVGKPCG